MGDGECAQAGWGVGSVEEHVSPGTFQAREPDRAVETQDTGHSEPMPDVAGGRQFWKGEEAGGILQQPGLQRPPPGFPHLLQKAATPQTGQLSPRIAGERGPDQCGRWGALCSLPPPFPLLRALSATFPQMSPRVWPWELLPRSWNSQGVPGFGTEARMWDRWQAAVATGSERGQT